MNWTMSRPNVRFTRVRGGGSAFPMNKKLDSKGVKTANRPRPEAGESRVKLARKISSSLRRAFDVHCHRPNTLALCTRVTAKSRQRPLIYRQVDSMTSPGRGLDLEQQVFSL